MDNQGNDSGFPVDSVVTIYSSLAEIEQRFNATQAMMKTLASTWMLAAFTGIALIVRGDPNVAWLLPAPVAAALIAFLGVSGLLVLWIIDYRVYQNLLGSAFLAGLRMEFDYPFLPPMRALMMDAAGGAGMRRWLLCFYLIPMLVLTAVAVAFALFVGHDHAWQLGQVQVNRLMLAVLALVGNGALSLVVLIGGLRVETLSRAELFDHPEFASLFKGKDFKALVKRYRPLRSDSSATGATSEQSS